MKRHIIVTEEFGVYYVEATGRTQGATGHSLENALAKIVPDAPPSAVFAASEVLEPLLGQRRGDGQIHTGVLPA